MTIGHEFGSLLYTIATMSVGSAFIAVITALIGMVAGIFAPLAPKLMDARNSVKAEKRKSLIKYTDKLLVACMSVEQHYEEIADLYRENNSEPKHLAEDDSDVIKRKDARNSEINAIEKKIRKLLDSVRRYRMFISANYPSMKQAMTMLILAAFFLPDVSDEQFEEKLKGVFDDNEGNLNLSSRVKEKFDSAIKGYTTALEKELAKLS